MSLFKRLETTMVATLIQIAGDVQHLFVRAMPWFQQSTRRDLREWDAVMFCLLFYLIQE